MADSVNRPSLSRRVLARDTNCPLSIYKLKYTRDGYRPRVPIVFVNHASIARLHLYFPHFIYLICITRYFVFPLLPSLNVIALFAFLFRFGCAHRIHYTDDLFCARFVLRLLNSLVLVTSVDFSVEFL